MKNFVLLFFLLAMMVSGCSQEEILKNGTSSSGGRVYTTSFEQDDSRTYVKDGLYSRWTEGDLISLFDSGTLNCQYLFSGKTGDSSGNFFLLNKPKGTGMPLSANYAVYPYSEDVKMTEEGMISVTLPSEQHYAENSYGLGDNTMVAVTKDVDDTFLSFKSVGGCFKLQLYGDDVTVKSITLMGNNGEKIAGKATIAAVYEGTPVVTMADDATTSITLDCGEKGVKIGATAEEATAFWIVIPPTTFEKGITVVVKDINNNVFTQTTDKQLAIERNVVKPMVSVKVEPKFPQLAFSADEKELEGWSAGLFAEEGTYVMGKPHSENGYMMIIGNVLENENSIVYMDESRQVREIFIDNTIISFGEYANGGVDVAIIEKDGMEEVKHIDLNVNSRRSRTSQDDYRKEGILNWAENLEGMYKSLQEIHKADGFSKKGLTFFIINKLESIRSITKTAGGADITNSEELALVLDVISGGGDIAELVLTKANIGWIYAGLILKFHEVYGECMQKTYGNCVASISDINYGNKTLNIDVKVSGYESTNSEVECGVIVRKAFTPLAPPVVYFPSNIETKMVTGNGNYSFSVGGIEEDQGYWCYPFVVEINRASIWIGFIGDVAGPLVRYGKAVKYEHDPMREALIKLYKSTNGDNWTRNDNWCSDRPITEWYGVRKSPVNDAVYLIGLHENGLTGKIDQTFSVDKDVVLYVYGNQLSSLDVSGSSSLTALHCDNNQLTSLDVSGCTALESLHCDNNQLTSLDVSGCTALDRLTCYNNQLTSLSVTGCTALEILSCDNNQLTSLSVTGCTALEILSCDNNQLTSLSVTGCTALEYLNCRNNKINSVIPNWFSQISFIYDVKYRYESKYIDGERIIVPIDQGYGWWYPGEPGKGKHSPN